MNNAAVIPVLETATEEIKTLLELWQTYAPLRDRGRFRPQGVIISGKMIFLHLARRRKGRMVPKLVAKVELCGKIDENSEVLRKILHLARKTAYQEICCCD